MGSGSPGIWLGDFGFTDLRMIRDETLKLAVSMEDMCESSPSIMVCEIHASFGVDENAMPNGRRNSPLIVVTRVRVAVSKTAISALR